MKSMNPQRTVMAIAAVAALGATMSGVAFADGSRVLRTGNVDNVNQWHGRGAGLEGADRITHIGTTSASQKPVTVTYDRVTVERTNMQRAQAPDNTVIRIEPDREVMARTNMPGAFEPKEPTQSAAAPIPVIK